MQEKWMTTAVKVAFLSLRGGSRRSEESFHESTVEELRKRGLVERFTLLDRRGDFRGYKLELSESGTLYAERVYAAELAKHEAAGDRGALCDCLECYPRTGRNLTADERSRVDELRGKFKQIEGLVAKLAFFMELEEKNIKQSPIVARDVTSCDSSSGRRETDVDGQLSLIVASAADALREARSRFSSLSDYAVAVIGGIDEESEELDVDGVSFPDLDCSGECSFARAGVGLRCERSDCSRYIHPGDEYFSELERFNAAKRREVEQLSGGDVEGKAKRLAEFLSNNDGGPGWYRKALEAADCVEEFDEEKTSEVDPGGSQTIYILTSRSEEGNGESWAVDWHATKSRGSTRQNLWMAYRRDANRF